VDEPRSAAVDLKEENGFPPNGRSSVEFFSVSSILQLLISLYQKAISPYLGHRCRYVPSCSEYMKDAIASRGALKGVAAGLARIFRCAPWGSSGLDLFNEK
jgi:putative membrane protein insertion efficiency factor